MESCRIDQNQFDEVDIEGSKVELLQTLPNDILDRINQMTVAFHDFKPEFDLTAKVRAALNRLIGLGWLPIVFSCRDNSDVLLINQKKLHLSLLQFAYFKYAARYVDGFLRVVGRKLPGGRRDSARFDAAGRLAKPFQADGERTASNLPDDSNVN